MVPVVANYTGMSAQVVSKMPLNVGAGIDLTMLQPVIDFAAIAPGFPIATRDVM